MDSYAHFGLVAPPLMWSEATSALREVAWRGVLSREAAVQGLRRLAQAPVDRRSPRGLIPEAWRVAEELGWAKTYDAEYVALSRLLGCRLLTRDARLKRGAGRLIEVVGPTEI
ncbi:MAG: type II toxin-antitoxin system VapC family toxin [Acidimicrobiales bacterium]